MICSGADGGRQGGGRGGHAGAARDVSPRRSRNRAPPPPCSLHRFGCAERVVSLPRPIRPAASRDDAFPYEEGAPRRRARSASLAASIHRPARVRHHAVVPQRTLHRDDAVPHVAGDLRGGPIERVADAAAAGHLEDQSVAGGDGLAALGAQREPLRRAHAPEPAGAAALAAAGGVLAAVEHGGEPTKGAPPPRLASDLQWTWAGPRRRQRQAPPRSVQDIHWRQTTKGRVVPR